MKFQHFFFQDKDMDDRTAVVKPVKQENTEGTLDTSRCQDNPAISVEGEYGKKDHLRLKNTLDC